MVFLILNGAAKTKLTVLAFLYCGEFVKNSNDQDTVILHIAIILSMFLHLSVILSTGGRGVRPQCMLGYTPKQTPPGQTPPRQTPQTDRHPP